MAQAYDHLGLDGIRARWNDGVRMLRENGVTYTIVGEDDSLRPWLLDPIPVVLGRAEWRSIEAGVVQRAELLEALLADCYGERHLLRDGQLPPAAVFAHPGFLRACHNVPPCGAHYLHLFAVDLLRTPDGSWVVTNHRCQAPTGFGYALENRMVLARSFPGIYRDAGAVRVAGFFGELLACLRRLAPRHRDNPRVVLLTPAPPHRNSFENAYLARYLNLPLVRGEDLTARDDGVFLKTLGGLEPVDVILRRGDDHRSDPLELDGAGSDGTAGLLHAARRGLVAVVNAFGAALAENAAWLGELPALCRALLGEELRLQSVATFWGPQQLDYIAAELPNLMIKPAFGVGVHSPIAGNLLGPAERDELLARLRERPEDYVAQAALQPSTSPTWIDDHLEARPLVIRAFAVRGSQGWRVMPGGLARVATGEDPSAFAMGRGGVAKDLWILADGSDEPTGTRDDRARPLELRRARTDVPSRVADHLFWFARYAERAENTARVVREFLLADQADAVEVLAQLLVAMRPALDDHIENWPQLLADPAMVDSIPSLSQALRRNALSARDRLSNDTWRLVNQLGFDFDPAQDDALSILESVITEFSALAGLAMENSVRGPGWHFLDLGRRIERAEFLAFMLTELVVGPGGELGLGIALELADSGITYRARYLTVLQAGAVVDLLLADASNPRSLRYQTEAIVASLEALPQAASRTPLAMASALAGRVAEADPQALVAGDAAALRDFLADVAATLEALAQELSTHYLSHTIDSRHLGRDTRPR